MKKLLVVLLALTVIGIFAFAQDAAPAAAAPVVTISDWGRQVFVLGNQDSGDMYAGLPLRGDPTPVSSALTFRPKPTPSASPLPLRLTMESSALPTRTRPGSILFPA
jgi:hypothetical protein